MLAVNCLSFVFENYHHHHRYCHYSYYHQYYVFSKIKIFISISILVSSCVLKCCACDHSISPIYTNITFDMVIEFHGIQ